MTIINDETNVVQFPRLKLDSPPQSFEEISQKIIEYKRSFAEEFSEMIWNYVLGELARAGCDFETEPEKLYPSMILILESIRSLYLEASGVHHPLQDFSKASFSKNEGEENIEDVEDVINDIEEILLSMQDENSDKE